MTAGLPVDVSDGALVTVRYWGSARAAAGVESESVEACDLADLLAQIDRRHRDRDRFRDVIGCCAILVGDLPVGDRDLATVTLTPGDRVDLLPPMAGGA